MSERIKKFYRWRSEFASNGWLDWFCPDCGKRVWNDDVHVSLDWDYCPLCGSKISVEEVEDGMWKMKSKKYRWKYETEQLKSKNSRFSRIIEFYKVSCPDCNAIVAYDSIKRKVNWDYCPHCGSKISYEE